jgi:hypothetical protein
MIVTSGSESSSVTPAGVLPKPPVTVGSKGLLSTTREQRRVILSEFESSRLSGAQFATICRSTAVDSELMPYLYYVLAIRIR